MAVDLVALSRGLFKSKNIIQSLKCNIRQQQENGIIEGGILLQMNVH